MRSTSQRSLCFPKGSIVACDRGYTDYALFARWTKEGVYFVTRQKGNADYTVVGEKAVPENRNILKDQIITFNGYHSKKATPIALRRIEVWDEENKEAYRPPYQPSHVRFHHHLRHLQGPLADRDLLQDDQAEPQDQDIRRDFPNALKIQIWTALIAILLLKYLKFRSRFAWSISNLIAMLRYNLFTYRDLWVWIDSPYEVPPIVPAGEQLALGL